MTNSSGHDVKLEEAHPTLRALMRSVLEEEGFGVVDRSSPPADLLIIDVDGPGELPEATLEQYVGSERPVLYVGLRHSRPDYPEDAWLERPFSPTELLRGCRRQLGLDFDSSFGEDTRPGAGESATRPVDYDSPEMTDQVGSEVEPGDKPEAPADEQNVEESDILEIDDASSMVLDIQEIGEHVSELSNGGIYRDDVSSEPLDLSALSEEARSLDVDSRTPEFSSNPTLPDVPSSKRPDPKGQAEDSSSSVGGTGRMDDTPVDGGSTGSRRAPSSGGSGLIDPDSDADSQIPVRRDDPADDSSLPPGTGSELGPSDSHPGRPGGEEWSEPDVEQPDPAGDLPFDELAKLVAESWDKLGLTARREDRAERLNRIFQAARERGLEGASDALNRIPPANGLSGSLQAFPPVELVQMIRRRGLLGRLEISNQTGGYVLYFDGTFLVGIDDLEGRSEAMLLDCLRQLSSVDEETYEELGRTLEESRAAPLEMRLRTESIVSNDELRQARQMRAKWVLKEVLAAGSGTFAFIHGNDESGQPWPVNELGLQIDLLLLELFRENEIGRERPTLSRRETFVTAGERYQAVAAGLRELEVEILEQALSPTTVDQWVSRSEHAQGAVEETVAILLDVGLLRRVGARDLPGGPRDSQMGDAIREEDSNSESGAGFDAE